MYKVMDESSYFDWVFSLIEKYDSRAYWGKINRYSKNNIDVYYPNDKQFNKIKQEMDPENIFVTHYLKNIFL